MDIKLVRFRGQEVDINTIEKWAHNLLHFAALRYTRNYESEIIKEQFIKNEVRVFFNLSYSTHFTLHLSLGSTRHVAPWWGFSTNHTEPSKRFWIQYHALRNLQPPLQGGIVHFGKLCGGWMKIKTLWGTYHEVTYLLVLEHLCWWSCRRYSTPRTCRRCCEYPACKRPRRTAKEREFRSSGPSGCRRRPRRMSRPQTASLSSAGGSPKPSNLASRRWSSKIPASSGAPLRRKGPGGGSRIPRSALRRETSR